MAVVITDTMGRAWRKGQIDAAIGSAGIAVLHGYAGTKDSQGNELQVTEVAVADEVAAAADLVKGKLSGIRSLSCADSHCRMTAPARLICSDAARKTCSGSAPPRR